MEKNIIKMRKSDAPWCIAELKAARVFINNSVLDAFMGRVVFYDKGRRLFSHDTNIARLDIYDALQDARELARDNGFTN